MKKQTEKILIAMSGGVDSSVAATLLIKQGYDVTGAYMINYDTNDTKHSNESCWVPDYRDAVRVAAKLGIPLIKLDFTKEYREMVLEYMYGEYSAGRTPNPDVMCNKFVKFGAWLDMIRELGFDKLATGHYANIQSTKGTKLRNTEYALRVSKDENKDQTYFLNQLNQQQLSHVLFPLGDYLKSEVRVLAEKYNLPTAQKEESMGICFVGEVPMKEFLKDKVKSDPGNIVMSNGIVVGKHEGLAFYTIGQRHIGLQSSDLKTYGGENKPLFVVEKHINTNELVVGFEDDPLLYKKETMVINVNWISGHEPVFPLQCEVRLRHRQPLQSAECRRANDELLIEFETPQRAVTPGQFAVIYKNGECLGGGVIK